MLGGRFAAEAAAVVAAQLLGEIWALVDAVVVVGGAVVVVDTVVDGAVVVVVGTPLDHHGGLVHLPCHSPGHLVVGAW